MTEIYYYDALNYLTSGHTDMTPQQVVGAFCSGCDNRRADGICTKMPRETQLKTATGGFCAEAAVYEVPEYRWLRLGPGGSLTFSPGKKS